MWSTLLTLAVTLMMAVPLGFWCKKVMGHEVAWISRTEDRVLAWMHISQAGMNWKQYLSAILALFLVSFLVLLGIFMLNGLPAEKAFNAASSFITNTNWQSYDPAALNWQSQAAGITVQNFVSAAAGICVLFALIRGLMQSRSMNLGNFWKDLCGSLLFFLLPLNLVLSLLLSASGVPMSMENERSSALIEPVAISANGEILTDAVLDLERDRVYVDEKPVAAQIIREQQVPLGLMASQEAIKQTGTNGGGLTQANSASPFENPTAFSNRLEAGAILLLPLALCFAFGFAIQNRKQGLALFAAMAILFGLALGGIWLSEMQAMNMEGKEVRIGIEASAFWAAATTAASSGSVNSALNSLSPAASLICMVLMQTGEVVFGGVGSGLYGMLAFVILTVFIAGLMVGRTPEFLSKKIEPFEMKWAVILCLSAPVCILIGSALGALWPQSGLDEGAHGFSQLLYAWTSMGANNGSAMAGFAMNGWLFNGLGGLLMLASRFIPMAGALAIAGSLSAKKQVAAGPGTLSTDGALFVFLLVVVVLLIGALSFFPALSLGPLAEWLQ